MSVIIFRTQANVCAAILADELHDEYGDNPVVENVRIDDGMNISITYDIAPNTAQLVQLDDVLALHDCSLIDDEETAGDNISGTVLNISGVTIPVGHPVYLTGFDVATGLTTVAIADASDPNKMPAIGCITQTLTNTERGTIVSAGQMVNLNTTAFTIGQEFYVAPGGGLTSTKPIGANLIQKMGEIQVVNAISGRVLIFGAGRTNDIPNLSTNKVWMGDVNSVPQETDIYTETEVDALVATSSQPGHTHVAADITDLTGGSGGNVGSIFHVTFMNESTTKNRWLEYMEDNSSDEVPFVVPFNTKLIAITFSNERDNRDTDVRLYKADIGNASTDTLIHTWSIRDARIAGKTVFAPDITFTAGDKVAVYLKDAGSDPKSPMVVLYFEKTDQITGDFLENFSGDF